MKIYVSINGVLRNTIQKFDYHYKDFYLNREPETKAVVLDDDGNETTEEIENFEYGINGIIKNDNILESYRFQSLEEFENFIYFEFPMEIYGHAGVSYPTAISDLNKFIHEHKEHNITLIGIDEMGKSKPATFFFLAKNGCLANDVKFIKSEDILTAWENCDVWISDSSLIVDSTPENKKVIKFNTNFNKHFTNSIEIDKLSDINELL